MAADNAKDVVDQYLARLRSALGDVPSAERDDIVQEIRSHILERIETEGHATEQVVDRILRAIGDPDELASQHKTESMLRRAATSKSPWLLLRTTLRWATTGMAGVIALIVTSAGYGSAAVCYLCGLLKPIFPDRVGLWLGADRTIALGYRARHFSATEVHGISVRPPASFVLGTLGTTEEPVRELLGPWLFPVTFLCGLLFVIATTWFARWFIRKFGRQKSRRTAGIAA